MSLSGRYISWDAIPGGLGDRVGALCNEFDLVPAVEQPTQVAALLTFVALLLSQQSREFADQALEQMRIGVTVNRERNASPESATQ